MLGLGHRSETVHRSNLSAIVRELHEHGPLSRSELGVRTGLTRSAIRVLIGELTELCLVGEGTAAALGTPGRPSSLVRPNPLGAIVLGIDVAVDSVGVAVVGLGGEILHQVRIDRPRGRISVDQTVADLVELVNVVWAKAPGREALVGIGVAVAGLVRRRDGLVYIAPNLGWRDVPFGAQLSEALQATVPLTVANEADLGALAEHRRGAAIRAENLIYISGEVGVGGGVIVDGRPLAGVAGYGGEVGHMPVNPNGIACRCGSCGCWETEIGEGALLLRAGHPPGGGRGEVDLVLQEAAAGVPEALNAVDNVGRWLGVGLAILVNVFDPEVIVLGGLLGRLHPLVLSTVEAELDRLALQASRGLVRVVPSRLGGDASLLGAAERAFEPMLSDPFGWAGVRTAPIAASA
ncbi:MAG: ROK family protein [Candidatus Limnocylindrales bacterium]|jgi:predicted NBD/HSP70 family sugar kinase